MARKLKTKPKSPAEILAEKQKARARDFEAVNLPADAATLPNHQDIEVTRAGGTRDGKKVDEDSNRRQDAFDALKVSLQRITGAYDAARRLERDILTRFGETDRGPRIERMDCEARAGKIDAMVAAGQAVDAVMSLLADRDQWLLMELIRPSQQRSNWRAHVFYVTGETHEHAQGACVRGACANLADAYRKLDMRPRRAA